MPLAEEGSSAIRTVKSEDERKLSFPLLGPSLALFAVVKTMEKLESSRCTCSGMLFWRLESVSISPHPSVTASCSASLGKCGWPEPMLSSSWFSLPCRAWSSAFLSALPLARAPWAVLDNEMWMEVTVTSGPGYWKPMSASPFSLLPGCGRCGGDFLLRWQSHKFTEARTAEFQVIFPREMPRSNKTLPKA